MLQGFKQFVFRGNHSIVVVPGAAFGVVVAALVKDLVTPLIAAIVGNPKFSATEFAVNETRFPVGDFINGLVSFILIAAFVYFVVAPPINKILRFFADFCCEKGAPSRQLEVKAPLYLPCPSWATG